MVQAMVAIITHGCPWGNQPIPTIVRPENIEHTSSKRAEHHNTWPKLKNPWLSMGQSTDTGQSASSKYRPYFIEKGRASQHMTQKGRALKSLPSQGNPTIFFLPLNKIKNAEASQVFPSPPLSPMQPSVLALLVLALALLAVQPVS